MTDTGGSPPPEGWFPDPGGSGQLRWWDGQRWTEHTYAAPATSGFQRPDESPERALHDERRIARWARYALWVYAASILISGIFIGPILEGMRNTFTQAIAAPSATPPTPEEMFGLSETTLGLLNLVSGLQTVAFIVLLVWVFRAATAASRLGIPAKRSPGWAVGSWFIPVLNLWWPYQSLRDMLPSGHPARPRILHLWIAAIVALILAMAGLLMSFADDAGRFPLYVGYLAVAVVYILGSKVISDVLEAHEQIAANPGQDRDSSGWVVRW